MLHCSITFISMSNSVTHNWHHDIHSVCQSPSALHLFFTQPAPFPSIPHLKWFHSLIFCTCSILPRVRIELETIAAVLMEKRGEKAGLVTSPLKTNAETNETNICQLRNYTEQRITSHFHTGLKHIGLFTFPHM